MENKFEDLTEDELRKAESLISILVHDVGKYVSRTAQNLPESTVPEVLVQMMVKDLFELNNGKSASDAFELLTAPLQELIDSSKLERCRSLLMDIDALESEIRRGQDAALRSAASRAIEVSSLLRSLAREVREALGDQ